MERAYNYAQERHAGQKRKSGKPYFTHPYRVADILADLMLDATPWRRGFCTTPWRTARTATSTPSNSSSARRSRVVDGVTKLSRLDLASREEQQGRKACARCSLPWPRTSAWC